MNELMKMQSQMLEDLRAYVLRQEAIIQNQEMEIEDLETQVRILNGKLNNQNQ
tara:strand:- start:109 stop:267 length:159 start_codon:yes stop_codon:yes gene_type:complete